VPSKEFVEASQRGAFFVSAFVVLPSKRWMLKI
jgi:hypothetical protein